MLIITDLEETLISISPKGKLKARPISEPIRESPAYFTRYNPLILKLPIPIAFITPISRNSSERVKVIVKRSTTNAMAISTRLTTRRIPAAIIFAGTSFVTTAFAPIIAPFLIVTPCKIVALEPIQTLSPIFIGFG